MTPPDGVALDVSQGVAAAVNVVEMDPLGDPDWKAFVEGRRDGLIYHHPEWLEALELGYGHSPVGLACRGTSGELLGVLPLCEARGLLSGRRLVSLPHTPVAGPLTTGPAATTALLRAAIRRTKGPHASRLQIKARSAELDGLVDGLVGRPWSETYARELPARTEELRFGNSRNHSRLKWAMNKAQRDGVEARDAASEADLRAWYRLYLITMRSHAVPPRPYAFFQALWTSLRPKGLMRLLLAERREGGHLRLLAGSMFLSAGETYFYAFNGCERRDFELRPNYLIQWRAIHDACEAGMRWYDMGEVEPGQDGLAMFKHKWGARPHALHRYYFPAPQELERGLLREGSRTRELGAAAWRRLPLSVTARVGESLYRYL